MKKKLIIVVVLLISCSAIVIGCIILRNHNTVELHVQIVGNNLSENVTKFVLKDCVIYCYVGDVIYSAYACADKELVEIDNLILEAQTGKNVPNRLERYVFDAREIKAIIYGKRYNSLVDYDADDMFTNLGLVLLYDYMAELTSYNSMW